MYVWKPALDGSHDVRSATTAENSAEEEHSLVPMHFRSYTKKYDCVDRSFVLDVIARSGVPTKVLAVICEFHTGMKTCVRTNDGDCSDNFDVRRGLMQRCVFAKLLLNMVFAAALRVA